MNFSTGSAPAIRNAAWTTPRIAPMINADEAEGMCLFSGLDFIISKLVAMFSDLHRIPSESEGK